MDITEEDINEFLDALDGHKCEDCGKYKSDVKYVECPFMMEIHNEKVMGWVCDACYHERGMDI